MKKKSFDPLKKVNVWFVGEEGRDTGGLTREMWRLFSIEVQRICEGKKGCLLIKHDATKLQVYIVTSEICYLASITCISSYMLYKQFFSCCRRGYVLRWGC